MPTANASTNSHAKRATSARTRTTKKTSREGGQDAIALLKADHRNVEKLFSQFEKARGETRKAELARQICLELRIHTQIEEELFYPQSREFLQDDDIVNEAIVEHQAAKDLIEQIEAMEAGEEMFEAKVTVLQEMIEHHVQEEEKEYFPQVQKSEMDLKSVGEAMKMRKQELTAEMGGEISLTQ